MKIHHIVHEYDNFTLDVRDISLTGNKIIGLVGANGSGKTTLMSILAGYLKANQMFDVSNYARDNVMFIPADVGLYDMLTVYDFVDLIAKHSKKSVDTLELLEQLELTDKKDEKVFYLSEGMKQKLSLIPLFTDDYEVLILDEPFNSVDMHYIRALKRQLKALAETTTIMISSHILDTLNDLCDEFVHIKDGRLVKQFANSDKAVLEQQLFQVNTESMKPEEERI